MRNDRKQRDRTHLHAHVHDGIGLVRSLAKQMAARHPIDPCDAIGFGNLGLLQAARSYRARKGVSFRAWASIRIRGAILDGVRAGGPVPRPLCRRHGGAKATSDRQARHLAGMLTASELGIIATFHTHDDRTRTPEQALVEAERGVAVRNALARLPPLERAIVERHYFEEETLTVASNVAGASKSWGSRLHAQALQRLHRELTRTDSL